MALDVNGIWQYTEGETAAPVSTMLNRLAGSVSTVLAPHVHDTGWITPTVAAGFTSTLKLRKIGSRVTVKGLITPTTNWGAINASNVVVATGGITSDFVPPENLAFTLTGSTTAAFVVFRVAWQTSGQVSIRCDTATSNSGVYVNFDYLVD